jgi:hypothetical protein
VACGRPSPHSLRGGLRGGALEREGACRHRPHLSPSFRLTFNSAPARSTPRSQRPAPGPVDAGIPPAPDRDPLLAGRRPGTGRMRTPPGSASMPRPRHRRPRFLPNATPNLSRIRPPDHAKRLFKNNVAPFNIARYALEDVSDPHKGADEGLSCPRHSPAAPSCDLRGVVSCAPRASPHPALSKACGAHNASVCTMRNRRTLSYRFADLWVTRTNSLATIFPIRQAAKARNCS